jgi:hypothetical protein
MATARAIANGNWSSTSTWNGGVLPGNGDTVYANGFNVTINQNITIGGANNPTVNAGSFVSGQWYEIDFVGTTSWTGIGAASNTVATVFLATGVGSGTGTAKAIATLTTAANTAAGATGGGGNFSMSSAYAITTDLRAGTTACLSMTGATSLTLDGLRLIAGTAASSHAISYGGTATLTIQNGATLNASATSSTAAFAVNNTSSGTVAISNSTLTAGGSSNHAVQNSSSGTITVSNSTLTGGFGSAGSALNNNSTTGVVSISACTVTGGSANNNPGVNNASTGSISITGSTLTGGTGSSSPAVNNTSTGSITISTSDLTATAFNNAFTGTILAANVLVSGNFLDHWSGFTAVYSPKFRLGTTPTAARHRMALAGTTDSYVNFFTADNAGFGLPAATDVRSGVSYGGGAATGTCAVPAAGSVAFGVPVDNTTGTAVLTPAAVWDTLTSSLTTSGSIGERLKNVSTVATNGEQLASALTAPL